MLLTASNILLFQMKMHVFQILALLTMFIFLGHTVNPILLLAYCKSGKQLQVTRVVSYWLTLLHSAFVKIPANIWKNILFLFLLNYFNKKYKKVMLSLHFLYNVIF